MAGDFVKGILDRLFKNGGDKNTPILSGKLERAEKFRASYASWLDSESRFGQLEKLFDAYKQASAGNAFEGNLQIYTSPQANGFFFNTGFNFPPEHYAFLIDYFKELVLEADYRLYLSDTKTIEGPNGIKTTDRHYLKPGKIDAVDFPIDQKYGNISIELVKLDEQPSYVKVMSGVYSDRNYQDPEPFSDLVAQLFDATR
jgi:hypothetical protein